MDRQCTLPDVIIADVLHLNLFQIWLLPITVLLLRKFFFLSGFEFQLRQLEWRRAPSARYPNKNQLTQTNLAVVALSFDDNIDHPSSCRFCFVISVAFSLPCTIATISVFVRLKWKGFKEMVLFFFAATTRHDR